MDIFNEIYLDNPNISQVMGKEFYIDYLNVLKKLKIKNFAYIKLTSFLFFESSLWTNVIDFEYVRETLKL